MVQMATGGDSRVEARFAHVDVCEVRWMTSGELLCQVSLVPATTGADVKTMISRLVNIPVEEQRLFVGHHELSHDAAPIDVHPDVLMLIRCATDPRISDLSYYRYRGDVLQLPQGEFACVRKINVGINGEVFQYRWGAKEVAVKQLRKERLEHFRNTTDVDERSLFLGPDGGKGGHDAEDALAEIGVLAHLAAQPDLPQYILRMLGVFSDDPFVWLVTELAEGGDLFEVAASRRLAEDQVRCFMAQLLTAVAYLHLHHIGHRDISLENVLLKDGTVRLMDFGMAVRSHSAFGTPLRFFRAVGKPYYRAPECYVPKAAEVTIVAPQDAVAHEVRVVTPPALRCSIEVKLPAVMLPAQPCKAEVWGYAAQPNDIFAVGVCCFIMSYQCPPWSMAMLDDSYFAYVHGNNAQGIPKLLQHWGKSPLSEKAMEFLVSALASEPAARPSAKVCLEGAWLCSRKRKRGGHGPGRRVEI